MSKEVIQKATHVGKIALGEIEISCAVLDDGTRVLVEQGMANALGKRGGGSHWKTKKTQSAVMLPEYLSASCLTPYIDDNLSSKLKAPIQYINKNGRKTQGVLATTLPDICDVWIKAKEGGALDDKSILTAQKAYILMRGFATVGIIALVDEATGYQEIRDKKALQTILDKYLTDEWAKWTKRFPEEFHKELSRLK